ncbi:Hypp4639 [Branchiostoma lanceolatum]|uniref:Hypp4639 protein n=1 Tax=Branchiostoma lanceolatum TaxID=7740 RepID=A0A8K0A8P8_BRALA|nr:Hypp4639 [Branchiostoma lanceolatum]
MADSSAEKKRRRSKTPERSESVDSGILTRSSERKKQKTEKDVEKKKRRSSFVRGRKSMHLLEQEQQQTSETQTADNTASNSGGSNTATVWQQNYADRLKTESSMWDSLCEEHSAAAENADNSSKDTTSDIPPWESLSAEQQRLLGGKPDLQDILDYTKKCRENLEVYVDKIASTTKTLSTFESTAEAFSSAKANELGMRTFKRMEHFNSPMTLISKIVRKTES